MLYIIKETFNNMGAINYKPGQILYIRSSLGPWYYISVLNHAAKHEHEAYESYMLYTCCDLCINEDGSECLTFTRGNSPFLDLDTSFDEVREATSDESRHLYNALVKAFKDHDLGWANHFTDSSYFDILDWLAWEFDVDLDAHQNTPLGDTIHEIQNYIWDALCKETGNYHACTDYVEPEMVNKQEFIEKAKAWLKTKNETCMFELEMILGSNFIEDFVKAMEE